MNRQLILMGPIKRKDGLDYLILTGQIEVKRTKRKQRISYLAGLSEAGFGSNCQKKNLLKATKDRKMWRGIIVQRNRPKYLISFSFRRQDQ